ncbi:hypothetical protein [Cellulosimicrobium arenosum]|uniref:Uncharacterized protein n=1 Tax=Cellulosimicrobium arenosum TaxID=2708133 RepID=A0A927PEW2_9MICO|nr:hypothetical protein [Cellulosimicrobium arenosum]MBD8079834.1 hypothetical protein [Cellulosimicrobium arenosum]
MDDLHGHTAAPARGLRDAWRATSAERVWLRAGDWYHPAVDALVEAVLERRDVSAAAERLGRARGDAGVGMGETLDDAGCLYRAHGVDPDHTLLRSVAVGWSEAWDSLTIAPEVVDPESGLATSQYLVHRLRETYGAAQRSGTSCATSHALVGVDVALDGLTGWQRIARSAAMGRALTQAFGEGHPMATLGNGVFVALAERPVDGVALGHELRFRIERTGLSLGVSAILRRPPRIWVEPLPATHAAAVRLLDEMHR